MWRKRLRRAIAVSFPAGFVYGECNREATRFARLSQQRLSKVGRQTPEFRGIRMTGGSRGPAAAPASWGGGGGGGAGQPALRLLAARTTGTTLAARGNVE